MMKFDNALLAAALVIVIGGCDRQDQHDTQATQAGDVAQPAQADSPMEPMSVIATDARIANLQRTTTDCNIESVNGQAFEPDVPKVSRNEQLVVTGWLVDASAGLVPDKVRFRIESADATSGWEQSVLEWGDRGDVVTTHGSNAAFQKSGFTVPLQIAQLPAGAYNVYLNYDTAAGDVSCAVGRSLVLTN